MKFKGKKFKELRFSATINGQLSIFLSLYKHLFAGNFIRKRFHQLTGSKVEDKSECNGYGQSRKSSLEYHQQQ